MSSNFIRQRAPHEITALEYQPFAIKEDVEIHMYCSEAPCGDASMELVMGAQADPTPWTETPPAIPSAVLLSSGSSAYDSDLPLLRGRSHFAYLGAVRLKPSRPDAPETMSKSCTDKLSHAQATSLLSSLTSLLLTPRTAYLTSLVLPKSQHVPSGTTRAFGLTGRMANANSVLAQKPEAREAGYTFRPFEIKSTEREFRYSRRSNPLTCKPVPSNLSAVYTPRFQESLIGGVLQGRKQFDARGASMICRKRMWGTVLDVATMAALPILVEVLNAPSYGEVKKQTMLAIRKDVKEAVRKFVLSGWAENVGDESFSLDVDGKV